MNGDSAAGDGMVRIASFNVENLFARPKALNGDTWADGRPILQAYEKVNELLNRDSYSASVKKQVRDLLVELDIYSLNSHGAVRRKQVTSPRWAWLRKNRGSFDREPKAPAESVEIVAEGRGDWIGWVELATETVGETATRMTARVIADINADIIGIVEAEDRPSLVRFNQDLLQSMYEHVMLIDGNDERGIDVGIMVRGGHRIESMRSHVDARDSIGTVFSRDCPQYTIQTGAGTRIHVLVNHFKSQSGGGGPKRRRQSIEVRRIVDRLVADHEHVIVVGDFNEGPPSANSVATNLRRLFRYGTPLVDCYALPGFQMGPRPGSFDACGIRNRLDYILVSQSLTGLVSGGGLFRKGLWGSRKTRPTAWDTYPDMTRSNEQASDHAAVFVDIDI